MKETKSDLPDQNGYNTVSNNLTVTGAQLSDQGMYYCNVAIGNGRVFNVSKKITVCGLSQIIQFQII